MAMIVGIEIVVEIVVLSGIFSLLLFVGSCSGGVGT